MTTPLPFTMSNHAVDRALEMGVTGEEIRACYDRPTDLIWSKKYKAWWFIRGRITEHLAARRAVRGHRARPHLPVHDPRRHPDKGAAMTPRRFTLQWFAQKATMMLITVAFIVVFLGVQMLIGPVG